MNIVTTNPINFSLRKYTPESTMSPIAYIFFPVRTSLNVGIFFRLSLFIVAR
jgi:hypothetical protein